MKFAFFLKISLLFNIFYCLGMFVSKESKSKSCYYVIPSVHFYVKTEMLADFQIRISVLLIGDTYFSKKTEQKLTHQNFMRRRKMINGIHMDLYTMHLKCSHFL